MEKVFIFNDVWITTIKQFIEKQKKYGITSMNCMVHKCKKGWFISTIIKTEETWIIFESLTHKLESVAKNNSKTIMKIWKNYVRNRGNN